jgi:hypothetical protein
VGRCIEAGIWRTSTHLLQGADLCHQGLRYASVPVQRDEALFAPLTNGKKVLGRQSSGTTGRKAPGLGAAASGFPGLDHSEPAMPSPECGAFLDDVAVSVVGALDRVAWGRLLGHLDVCTHCGALRSEYEGAVRALEMLVPLGPHPSRLSQRIMGSIRRLNEVRPSVAPQDPARAYGSERKWRTD